MLNIQKAGRNKKIAGRRDNGSVEKIEDLYCARKHVIEKRGWNKIDKFKNFFTFVSSPKIYKQKKMIVRSKGWCHPFRDPIGKLPKDTPRILMPESDFMDPMFVCYKKSPEIKYDYFYFTINSPAGIQHKGLFQFIEILPTLCQHKLKGLIIVYFPNAGVIKRFNINLTSHQKNILRRCDKYLKFHWGLLSQDQVGHAMTSCRFGLFPNTVDNSPRLISEALIRNIPVLVNEQIHGGWHYIDKSTGCLFDKNNLNDSLGFMMNNQFNAREYFIQNYGFEKSSKRLCDFLSNIFGYTEYTHMYFYDYRNYLSKIK